jgi:hypothetical protein
MSDNPDRNIKNAVHSWVHALKRHMALRKADEVICMFRQNLTSFFKPALLSSKTSTISESSIDE